MIGDGASRAPQHESKNQGLKFSLESVTGLWVVRVTEFPAQKCSPSGGRG